MKMISQIYIFLLRRFYRKQGAELKGVRIVVKSKRGYEEIRLQLI